MTKIGSCVILIIVTQPLKGGEITYCRDWLFSPRRPPLVEKVEVVLKSQVVFEGKASIRFGSGAIRSRTYRYVSISNQIVMHLSENKIAANPFIPDNAAIGHKMGV